MDRHTARRAILTEIPEVRKQARELMRGLKSPDTQTLLAVRVLILHWCLDGILRMRAAHAQPPPVSQQDASYREAFGILNGKTAEEWLDQLTDLFEDPKRDGPGVTLLLILLARLDILTAEMRRRMNHRGIRRQWEASCSGQPNAPGILRGLLQKMRVFKRPLKDWHWIPGRAGQEIHDGLCLSALGELVTARRAALKDVEAGSLIIGESPPSPLAALYPVADPWWVPVAARLRDEDILSNARTLYQEVDDSLERYPLDAKNRLREYELEQVKGKLPLAEYEALGGELDVGKSKGGPEAKPERDAQWVKTPAGWELRAPRPAEHRRLRHPVSLPVDHDGAEEDKDFVQAVQSFICANWGKRMLNALKLRLSGATWEEVAAKVRIDRRELERRRKIIREWVKKYGQK